MSEEIKKSEEQAAPVTEAPAAPEKPAAPVTEAPAPAKEQQEAVDEMQKASTEALESMREKGNKKNDEVIEQAKTKLDEMYNNFREWLKENTQPDKVRAELENFKNETVDLLNKTREKAIEVSNSEQFKSTMKAGADFLTGTGAMISEGFKYGYDKLMEVPEFKKVADKVDEGVDKLRHSKFLADVVDGTEKGISEFNNAVFNGLKNFFDDSSKKSEPAKTEPESKPEDKKSE